MNLQQPESPELTPTESLGAMPNGPNNLGPTLLISLGLIGAPIGLGVPLLLLGLALLRTSHGASAFPLLASTLASIQQQLQAWSPR